MLNLTPENKLLIVDDCQVYTTVTREMLVKLGLSFDQINIASNSSDCIRLCREHRYQVILLDHNLSEDADGQQVLSYLRRQNLIGSDCVVVVVTANNSVKVVRSFLELEPDGYLVKPLSFELVKARLPSIINRKLTLAKSYQQFEEGKFESAITSSDSIRDQAQDLLSQCLLLQAESFFALGRYDDARNILISIPEGQDSPKVALALSKVYQAQNQFALAIDVLTKYLDHPIYSAAIHERLADTYFLQLSISDAVQAIQLASEFSPENCERQLKRAYIALAAFDMTLAIEAMESALKFMSPHDERYLETMQKFTQLLADHAYFSGDSVHKMVSKKIADCCTYWRRHYEKTQYKPFELLLLARFNATLGFNERANRQYKEIVSLEITEQEDICHRLEWLKLCYLLNKMDKFDKTLQDVIQKIASLPGELEDKALEIYMAKWRYNIDQNVAQSARLFDEAKRDLSTGDHHSAFPKLINALNKHRGNLDISQVILQSLTIAWPTGWNKHQVKHLAQMCVGLLKNSHHVNQTAFKSACHKISQRIDAELLPNSFLSAA
ncbi:response regulator [uncultured Vibrio sp.]|uniref:response regulator n=1 Tax=uncultured Vibrio sp. TaxID=114054 RepID=UPI0025F67D0A|nr:response regulator [uncultured Vibrio sp.]